MVAESPGAPGIVKETQQVVDGTSGVATPGPTRAQALVKFVCTLVSLFNSQA